MGTCSPPLVRPGPLQRGQDLGVEHRHRDPAGHGRADLLRRGVTEHQDGSGYAIVAKRQSLGHRRSRDPAGAMAQGRSRHRQGSMPVGVRLYHRHQRHPAQLLDDGRHVPPQALGLRHRLGHLDEAVGDFAGEDSSAPAHSGQAGPGLPVQEDAGPCRLEWIQPLGDQGGDQPAQDVPSSTGGQCRGGVVIDPTPPLRVHHHRPRSLQHQDGAQLSGQSLRRAAAVTLDPRDIDPRQSRRLQGMGREHASWRYLLTQLGISGTDVEGIGIEYQAPAGRLGEGEERAQQLRRGRALPQARPANDRLRRL